MLAHLYGMSVGGSQGVTITLISQLLCILGTPGGFMLATNSALMEMVPPEERTAMFGVLGGAQMAGLATGLLCEYRTECRLRRSAHVQLGGSFTPPGDCMDRS